MSTCLSSISPPGGLARAWCDFRLFIGMCRTSCASSPAGLGELETNAGWSRVVCGAYRGADRARRACQRVGESMSARGRKREKQRKKKENKKEEEKRNISYHDIIWNYVVGYHKMVTGVIMILVS